MPELQRVPIVTIKQADSIKTRKYRVVVEFFGIDDANSFEEVKRFAEWNLVNQGCVVTALSIDPIGKEPVEMTTYEWSVEGVENVKRFEKDPDAELNRAFARHPELKKRKARYLPAPKPHTVVRLAKATEKRGNKCYDTAGENPGAEVPCPAESTGGGGWHC